MLARLWWKEYRLFGPVWLIMGAAAAGLQWFQLTVGGEYVRSGSLTQTALIWAVLYAFAVGAAAFAGEREAKTIDFLDALPVDRRTLWLGKSTFSMASTFGLALVLGLLAALGTRTRDPGSPYGYGTIVPFFATAMFAAAAWGLFWSSISRNTLLAGAMSVVSVGVVTLAANKMVSLDQSGEWKLAAIHLLGASVALAGSALAVAWRPRKDLQEWIAREDGVIDRPGTIVVRRASTGRSLAWQTWREGSSTGLLVVLVGLVLPVGGAMLGERHEEANLMFAVLASLVAGVSVFGTENASGSRPFLVQHGVAAGTVWGRKMLAWGPPVALYFALSMLSFRLIGSPFRGPQFGPAASLWDQLAPIAVSLVAAFAVGVFCGMVIRRRITAALVAVMGLVAVAPLQIAMHSFAMIPAWSLFLTPLILLAITRAWAGDWLLDRGGLRPWARLGFLIVVPFGLLGTSYVAYRAYGVPDVGPRFDPASMQSGAIPPGENAAEVYRRAVALIRITAATAAADEVIERGWNPKEVDIVAWVKANQPAIELARKASAMPRARFEDVERMTFGSKLDETTTKMRFLDQLLALDARERQSRGDLAGMWDDILAQFRMANQLSATTPLLMQAITAAQFHHRAVGLAFDWLGDPKQTPVLVRRALADLKDLPPPPSLAMSLRVESSMIDRTLDLPSDELSEIITMNAGGSRTSTPGQLAFNLLVAPSWERQRARRVCRRIVAELIPIVEVEPWRRDPAADRFDRIDSTFGGSMLARMLLPGFWYAVYNLDRELVGRRALEQAVAIRAWRFEHGGDDPETLEALVPGLLDRLPLDPYSGRPFGYVRSVGQPTRLPILSDFGPKSDLRPTRPGQRLLYSVGPDRKDDGGTTAYSFTKMNEGDYLFAVP